MKGRRKEEGMGKFRMIIIARRYGICVWWATFFFCVWYVPIFHLFAIGGMGREWKMKELDR